MISIRKYLDTANSRSRGAVPGGEGALLGLCLGLLEGIGTHVLDGDADSELCVRLAEIAGGLREDPDSAGAERAVERVGSILARNRARIQESAQRNAVEMQHIVGVLNQALRVLAGGNERSVSRLQTIQGALERTSRIHDAAGLRASLADAVQLIREEAIREREAGAEELNNFRTEVAQAREMAACCIAAGVPGRAEGMAAIRRSLQREAMPGTWHVVVLAIKHLAALVQRYGPYVVDELFVQLVRERMRPVTLSNMTFRWSAGSAVGIITGGDEEIEGGKLARLRSALSELNRHALIHKVTLGNRTAVLKVGVAWLAAPGTPGDPDSVIAEIDHLTGAEA